MLLFIIRGLSGFLRSLHWPRSPTTGCSSCAKPCLANLSARLTLFTDQNASTIANTVVYEVFNGSSSLINAVMRLARDVLTLLALISYLIYLNWKPTLICWLPVSGGRVCYPGAVRKRLYRLTKESQTATDSLAYAGRKWRRWRIMTFACMARKPVRRAGLTA